MKRGVRWYLVGSVILVALAGCKPGWLGEEREPWRGEAEQACLKSGAVREGPSVVLLPAISGPGMCGADYPLKVSALGESSPLGYEDEAVRPPGDVPQAPRSYPAQPPYQGGPPYQGAPYGAPPTYRPPPQYPANPPFAVNPAYPHDTRLPPNPQYGAPPSYPAEPPPPSNRGYNRGDDYEPAPPPEANADAQRVPVASAYPDAPPVAVPGPYSPVPGPNGPVSLAPPGYDPPNAEAAGDYQTPLPRYGARPAPAPPPAAPFPPSYPGGAVVPMSPAHGAVLAGPVSVSPAATLACPIVSALDRWISEAVQPAAQKWFGQPVTGIKQISAYSCRGMNGNPNAHISEHAFGNALDIAAFVFADGHVVTVEHGWHGTAEEQGFLRDVQGAACQMFTTVLAPGANVYHYNHIHVDLMRRSARPHICEPGAVSGDEIAARVRTRYAGRDNGVTGSIGSHRSPRHEMAPSAYSDDDRRLPDAVAGED